MAQETRDFYHGKNAPSAPFSGNLQKRKSAWISRADFLMSVCWRGFHTHAGSSLWQALTSATNFSPQKAQAFLDGIFLCHNAPAWQLVPTGYYALSHTNCGDEPAAARLCHASCFEKLRPSPRRFVRSQRAQGPILYTGIRPGIPRIQQVSVSAPLLRSMTLLRPFSITQ